MGDIHIPDCERCVHIKDCSMVKALKVARETIFNLNREKSGRNDFLLNGKIVRVPPKEETE